MTVLSKSHQRKEQEERRSGCDRGKIEMKLSEVNARTVSRGCIMSIKGTNNISKEIF